MPLLWRRLHRSPTGLLNPCEQWIASVPCVKRAGLLLYDGCRTKCQSALSKKRRRSYINPAEKDFHPEQLIVAHAGQGLVDLPMTVTDPSMTNEGVSK